MANEEGIVFKLGAPGAGTAWVKTNRASACESCTSRDSCHMEEGGAQEMEVEALNTANARVGDTIVLNIKTSSFLKATFLLYVFPILALIAGAMVGQTMAEHRGMDPSAMAALVGFLAFGLSFVIIRFMDRHLSGKASYKPEIIKVRRPGLAPAETQEAYPAEQ